MSMARPQFVRRALAQLRKHVNRHEVMVNAVITRHPSLTRKRPAALNVLKAVQDSKAYAPFLGSSVGMEWKEGPQAK
jgi:hypothetical protein